MASSLRLASPQRLREGTVAHLSMGTIFNSTYMPYAFHVIKPLKTAAEVMDFWRVADECQHLWLNLIKS
jgi:hypothetical protein